MRRNELFARVSFADFRSRTPGRRTPGGFRGGFQRRFNRGRDAWVRFAKSRLALIASALGASEVVRPVRHRSRR